MKTVFLKSENMWQYSSWAKQLAFYDMRFKASEPFMLISTPKSFALDVIVLTCAFSTSSKVLTPLTTAAATFSFSAVSMFRNPHMTKPFSAIIRSIGAEQSGKSTRRPKHVLPSTFKLETSITLNTFKRKHYIITLEIKIAGGESLSHVDEAETESAADAYS